jgi:hypothetical protein
LRARIKSLEDHAETEEQSDSIALIKAVRNAMFSYKSVRYWCESIHNALKRFWQLHQGKHHSCQQYLEELENCIAVIDHCGGLIGVFPGIVEYLYTLRGINNPTYIEVAQATKDAQEMSLQPISFLMPTRCGMENSSKTHRMSISRVMTLTQKRSLPLTAFLQTTDATLAT